MEKNNLVFKAQGFSVRAIFYCLSFFVMSCWFSTGANAFFWNKVKTPSLAIIGAGDFSADAIANQQTGLPEDLAARIVERLTKSRRFKVLERKALRKVVMEQRFGSKYPVSDVDRLLDKAVDDLEDINAGTLAVAGILSGDNDVLTDFKDLGTAVGADYIVYARLEKLQKKTTTTAVPFSKKGKTTSQHLVDARLYLRVIDVKKGQVIGAESFQSQISEQAFNGNKTKTDLLSIFDELGRQASGKIIDIVSPAQIIGIDPHVINRGENDGVKVGDIYVIEREGRELKDASGIKLGRLRTTIGKIQLTKIQETLSSAKLIEGEASVDDLAVLQVEEKKAAPAGNGKRALNPKETQSQTDLPRIAIGFMKSGSTASTTINANKHIPATTDSIISRLSQTKRFVVIDRQEVDQLLEEQTAQALQENRELPSALGDLKGADYLVYGSLASFTIKERTTKLSGSTQIFKSKTGQLEGNVRIVDAHSGEIIESRKVSVFEKIDPNDSEVRSIALLADAYAEQVVLNLMNAIYPIKVAHFVADGTVYINRGSDGGLFVGETLKAYRLGDAVIDPDTGLQLGSVESLLGEVHVTEVEDARSKANSLVTLQSGDLLKRSVDNKKTRSGSSGGEKTVFSGANIGSGKPSGKATLAIGRFPLSKQGNNGLLKGDMIDRLTSDLFTKLSGTRRFELMERAQIEQLLDEKAFTAIAQDKDINDSLHQLKGADYLIFGTINDFFIQTQKKKIAAVDKVQITQTGIVEASLRIVDVHSGQILAAEKVRLDSRLNANKTHRQQINSLISKLSDKMIDGIISRVYPFKVLGVSGDGQIFVNRGKETGLVAGDRFQVLRPGEKLIDLDTGIDFGTAEMQIAKIVLTQIENGRSRAKILSGNGVQRGDILRKIKGAKKQTAGKKIQKINQPDF